MYVGWAWSVRGFPYFKLTVEYLYYARSLSEQDGTVDLELYLSRIHTECILDFVHGRVSHVCHYTKSRVLKIL